MHVVILGCGRVGSTLARTLEGLGHSVAIVDQNANAFRRLGSSFAGKTVTGVGFDRDTLLEADIESAAAFAAVSSGDNSNIIAARVARETFGVAHVVARIYDPKRAEVYERLGIPTVATVRWTANQVLRLLLPEDATPSWTDPSGKVVLAEVPVPVSWAGLRVSALEDAAGARAAVLTRLGTAQVIEGHLVVQEGDLFHFVLPKDRVADVTALVAAGPRGGGH